MSLGLAAAHAGDTACQGFGSDTLGGSASSVYHVTTTIDSGPGSLRDAVSAGNRLIVFDVGGWFSVDSDIAVTGSFITIDGSTAPTPVLLVHHGLVVSGAAGAHDIVIKNLRIRNAEGPAAIQITGGARNVVVDHVSINGAFGGSIDISNSTDVSVCWSLLASPADHNLAVGNVPARVSLHDNVFVGAASGNPTVAIDAAGTPASDTTLDMRNNVVWSWGGGWGTVVSNGAAANVVNNLFSSPESPPAAQTNAIIVCNGDCAGGAATNARAYVAGNVSGDALATDINAETTETLPFPAPVVATLDACQASYSVVAGVGVRPLDTIDRNALNAVTLPSTCVSDLVVDTVTVPAAATAGTTVSVTDTTRNQGIGQAGPSTTRLFFSSKSYMDAEAVPLGSRSVPSLAPGGLSSGTTSVTIPSTAGSACTYYILAQADADNANPEADKTNNVGAQSLKVCPDLLVDTLAAPDAAGAGSAIVVNDTVRNRGFSGAPATTMKFYVSTLTTYDSSAILIGSRPVPAIEAGATDSASTSLTLPASVGAASTYYVIAVLDPDNGVAEYDESNNETWVKIKIGPDLHITGAITAPATAAAGSTIQVTETTRNRGVSPAGASVTRLYLGTTVTFDASAVAIGSRAVPALEPAATSTATTSVTIPASVGTAGTYYLFAVADGDNQVVESDETNNASYAIVKIGPDLHITGAITAPATAAAGSTIQVTETTRNRGVGPANPSVTKFYLATVATFDASAIAIGSRAVPALEPAATSTATTSVTIPASVGAAGTYYLFAVADGDNQVVETDETNNTNYAVVKIGPDLHISGAITAPATAAAGSTIQVTETTRNRGVGPANPSVTKFYLATVATFDASAVAIGSRPVPALEPGAVSTATTSVTIPASVGAAGTYYLFAVADGDNQVVETDETNNSNYAIVKAGGDLVTSGAITAPATAAAGSTIQVTETTRNRGAGPVNPSVTKFYLATTPAFDASAIAIGSRAVPALEPGAVSTATTSVTIPASVGTAGTYYLFAVVDADNQVAETDETNNATSYAIVKIGPDLHISGAITAPASAGAGATIQVTETTRNRGVGPANASVTKFYLATAPAFDASAIAIGGRPVPALEPGAISTATTSVTLPANIGSAGTYYLFAVVDGDGQLVETDETNNATAYAVVKLGADLVISGAPTVPATAVAGSTIPVTETTRNRGVGTANPSVTKLYLATAPALDASAIVIGSRAVPALEPGATNTATTSVTIPVSAGAAGTYYLFAVADGDGQVAETDESNNTDYAPVKISPDFVVTAVNGPSSTAPGATITIFDTTKNQGVSGAPASVTRYYLSTSTTFDASAIFLGSRSVPALDVNATHAGSATVTIPASAAGYYNILAVANAGGEVGEPNRTNNSLYAAINVGPDLTVTGVNAPLSASPGGTISVTDGTKNRGVATAVASVTRFYLSTSPTRDASAIAIGSRAVPALDPGATSTAATDVTIPAGAGGTYYLLAVADADNQIGELDESNNTASTTIRIGPDLTITGVSAPLSAAPGGTIAVSDGTKNKGVAPAPASTTKFYLSTSSAFSTASATLLGSRAVPALDAGVTSTASTSLTVPAGIGGTYYLFAVADADGQISELDEANNVASTSLSIGPDLTVTGVAAPTYGAPGAVITVSDTTKNRGFGASGPSVTKYYLSASGGLDAGAVLLGSRTVPALDAGAVSTASVSLTIPATATGSAYYVLAVADGDSQVAELDEANNVASALIRMGADLTISGIAAPPAAIAGTAITITDTTRNRGFAASTPSVTRFYLSAQPALDATAILLGSRPVPGLAAGDTSIAATAVTIPPGVGQLGAYYLFAIADADGAVAETDETNNVLAVAIKIGGDLATNGLTAPATAVAGTAIVVTETTRNRGIAPTAAAVTRFYLSTSLTLDGSAMPLGDRIVPSLEAGAMSTVSTTLAVPATVGAAGTYVLFAVSDPDGQIIETDETNNATYAVVKIGPDLATSGLAAPKTAVAGAPIVVTETTRNRGVAPAAASTTSFYLSTSLTVDASAILLGNRAVPALDPGVISTVSTTLSIPATVGAAGTYYVIAVANGEGALVETDETNNASVVDIKIGPDLTLTAVSGPYAALAGEVVSIADTAKNRGIAPAAASSVMFYFATKKTYDPADAIYLGARAVPALAAGFSNYGSTALTIPSVPRGRTYYILVIVDGQGAIVETNENNNLKYWPVLMP